ncbi:MAG: ATP-binding protein, partial [Aggregatilineales bacterium]
YGEALSVYAIGISRGLVYAGTVGGEVRHEYSTIGDETNVAARLMGAASGGRILVSSAVYKAVSGRVIFETLPEVTIKGRSEPIPVAEPIRFRSGNARPIKLGALVGRAEELARLERHLKAVQGGHPRLVRLEGEAGIGKSHLVVALTQRASEHGFRIGQGESLGSAHLTAYLTWRSILAGLLGLPLESESATADALISAVKALMPEDEARLPLLGDVLNLSLPETPLTASLEGQKRQQATFALVSELLRRLAARQPLLLIFEDAQWIDESSACLALDLVQQLGVATAPILLLLAHRPLRNEPTAKRFVGKLRAKRLHHHIQLGELSRAEIAQLLEKTLDAPIRSELLTFICQRTQGNPFFALQLAEALRESDQLVHSEQGLSLRDPARSLNIPQTVQGLVQARLDSLSEIDQLIIKHAAVIGREFSLTILADSLPIALSAQEVEARLMALEGSGCLNAVRSGHNFAFKHPILQEAVYQSMLAEQRAEIHHSVAHSLERHMPEAIEALAYHFARSNSREEALRYTLQAGRKAFAEYANFAALEYFAQAEALAHSDADRFEIWRREVRVLLRLGELATVADKLPYGIQLAEQA